MITDNQREVIHHAIRIIDEAAHPAIATPTGCGHCCQIVNSLETMFNKPLDTTWLTCYNRLNH